jgi:integrase
VKLSTQSAKDLQPGKALSDHVVKGLQLRARGGGKTWSLVYRNAAGMQRRYTMKPYPALTIEAARDVARGLQKQIAAGVDPAAAKASARVAPTVADLVDEYAKRPAATIRKARSLQAEELNARLYIVPAIGKKKVAELTIADIQAAMSYAQGAMQRRENATAARNGKQPRTMPPSLVTANRVRAMLSGMLNFAESPALAWRPMNSNPIGHVPQHKEIKRRRKATAEELQAARVELDRWAPTYPNRVAAIKCIALTGSRVLELLKARRDQIDGTRLILDEHKTDRTGAPRIIHLPTQALELIYSVSDEGTGLLFGPLEHWHVFSVWDRVRKSSGFPDLQIRDLRRTFASMALSSGANLSAIGKLLGHRSTATTDGYAYLMDEAETALTQATANKMNGG